MYKRIKPTAEQCRKMARRWHSWEAMKTRMNKDYHSALGTLQHLPPTVAMPSQFLLHISNFCIPHPRPSTPLPPMHVEGSGRQFVDPRVEGSVMMERGEVISGDLMGEHASAGGQTTSVGGVERGG